MKTFLVLLLLALPQTGIQPVPIPISPSSWHFTDGRIMPNGDILEGNGGSFSQDLGISPKTIQAPSPGWQYGTEGTYILTFDVVDYFPNYPGYYTAEIDFGTQELCEASGWGKMRTAHVTLVCPASNYIVLDKSLPLGGPVQGTQNLVLHFTVNGWQMFFSNINLTFTPEAP